MLDPQRVARRGTGPRAFCIGKTWLAMGEGIVRMSQVLDKVCVG